MFDVVKVSNKIYEVEISSWSLFSKGNLRKALRQIEEEGRTVTSICKVSGIWTYRYLVFTDLD